MQQSVERNKMEFVCKQNCDLKQLTTAIDIYRRKFDIGVYLIVLVFLMFARTHTHAHAHARMYSAI